MYHHHVQFYWNGTALSEELPAQTDEEPPPPPSLTDQLAFLEKSPESPEALEAAIWIVLNNPDGPAVNTALEVIQSHHIRAPGLLTLCREQERVRHRGSRFQNCRWCSQRRAAPHGL